MSWLLLLPRRALSIGVWVTHDFPLHPQQHEALQRGGTQQITIKADKSRVNPKLHSLHRTPQNQHPWERLGRFHTVRSARLIQSPFLTLKPTSKKSITGNKETLKSRSQSCSTKTKLPFWEGRGSKGQNPSF